MTFRYVLIYSIKPLLKGFFPFFVIAVGIFILLIDRKELQSSGKKRDVKLAKVIGTLYMIAGPLLYLIGRII